MNRTLRGYLLVLIAATLWASLGVFYKFLINGYGLQPLAAAVLRGSAGSVLLLAALLTLRVNLRVPRRDWPSRTRPVLPARLRSSRPARSVRRRRENRMRS